MYSAVATRAPMRLNDRVCPLASGGRNEADVAAENRVVGGVLS